MSHLWSLFIVFWKFLPWVAIGLMAAVAFRKRKESKALLLQAGGAGAIFLLRMAQWVVGTGLVFFNTPWAVRNAVDIIFEFLLFLALVAFAVGYCAERFSRKPAGG